jgi:hypothetical protein
MTGKQSTGPIELVPGENCLEYAFVGSRVTCEPPVLDTDCDIIILFANYNELNALQLAIYEAGGETCGRDYGADGDDDLLPMRLGEFNYLLTMSVGYYRRFLDATGIAKHLNILCKDDRKALFACMMDGDNTYLSARIKSHSAPIGTFI